MHMDLPFKCRADNPHFIINAVTQAPPTAWCHGREHTQMELAKSVAQVAVPVIAHEPGSPLSAPLHVPP